ncbi:MAG: winged helix-turn-helix domain-containing protein, partial [Candidatus Aenigmarchaeota archaeon]|nr:winged helix-turn-helix domain-containing protein [Candidatus Aenigmarchaeota archaeon]
LILELLEKHTRLTASDVSVKLNLSRTRCSEYLTELEKSGVTEGIIVSRQKIYTLKNQ